LFTGERSEDREDQLRPETVRKMVNIAKEHNREAGAFNYNFPQNFYSTFPEIDREFYVTFGGPGRRRMKNLDVDLQ
jgi:hypothetical protein